MKKIIIITIIILLIMTYLISCEADNNIISNANIQTIVTTEIDVSDIEKVMITEEIIELIDNNLDIINTIMGQCYTADTKTYLNGHLIDNYSINGRIYICIDDLVNYGFYVTWDAERKISAISVDLIKVIDGTFGENSNPVLTNEKSNIIPGTLIGNYYKTDIQTYFNGQPIDNYNIIGGRIVIDINDFSKYGFKVRWDNNNKMNSITLDYSYYNFIRNAITISHDDINYCNNQVLEIDDFLTVYDDNNLRNEYLKVYEDDCLYDISGSPQLYKKDELLRFLPQPPTGHSRYYWKKLDDSIIEYITLLTKIIDYRYIERTYPYICIDFGYKNFIKYDYLDPVYIWIVEDNKYIVSYKFQYYLLPNKSNELNITNGNRIELLSEYYQNTDYEKYITIYISNKFQGYVHNSEDNQDIEVPLDSSYKINFNIYLPSMK